MRNNFFVQGLLTLALAFAFIFTGCDDGGNPPVSTIWSESDGNGFIRSSTNDPQYYGWAWWNFYGNINDPNTYEIECKKMSGASNYTYGMLFGASDDDDYKYYYLAISVDGTYYIGKIIGNNEEDFTYIKEEEKSDKLKTGYNVINILKVVKNGAEYTVYLNGSQECQFTDPDISGNRIGYRVRIGTESEESFPNTPVDVRFRQRYGSGNNGNLPVSTTEWEYDENGFIQFSYNDPQKYDWSYWYFYNGQTTYEIECKKMNGAGNVGYGMVFGASDTDTYRFYLLEITIHGEYSLWKNIDNNYIKIKDWADSEKLNTGYNVINNLKVVKNGTTFTVYLNGSQVHQFTDTQINGNRFGYYVAIGSKNIEAFPNMPVDVRFRQKEEADEFLSSRQIKLPVNFLGAFGTNLTGSLSYPQDAQAAPR